MDKESLEDQLLLMKGIVPQAKGDIIDKLTRKVKELRDKSGDENHQKHLRKADRLEEQADLLQKLKQREITKFVITNEKLLKTKGDELTLENKVLIKVSNHELVRESVDKFRECFPNWRSEVPLLLPTVDLKDRKLQRKSSVASANQSLENGENVSPKKKKKKKNKGLLNGEKSSAASANQSLENGFEITTNGEDASLKKKKKNKGLLNGEKSSVASANQSFENSFEITTNGEDISPKKKKKNKGLLNGEKMANENSIDLIKDDCSDSKEQKNSKKKRKKNGKLNESLDESTKHLEIPDDCEETLEVKKVKVSDQQDGEFDIPGRGGFGQGRGGRGGFGRGRGERGGFGRGRGERGGFGRGRGGRGGFGRGNRGGSNYSSMETFDERTKKSFGINGEKLGERRTLENKAGESLLMPDYLKDPEALKHLQKNFKNFKKD